MFLEDYLLPEMLRTRLEEVILQAKILQLGFVKPFLERVLDPPDPVAIELSLKVSNLKNFYVMLCIKEKYVYNFRLLLFYFIYIIIKPNFLSFVQLD